jgi:hypothetical protein
MKPIPLLTLLLLFALRQTSLADPFISEFMADNKTSIRDEDNDKSDWIEIYNPDNAAVNMNGWYLTDKLTNLTQWQFPAVTIPSKGFLIVWATSKNRRIPGAPLHTNFGLSKDGESLALTKPNGTTVVSQYTFGAQFEDVSYGTSSTIENQYLIQQGPPANATGSALKLLIPTASDNTAIGTTWRNRTFADASWTSGTQAIGFFNSGANPDLSSQLGVNLTTQMGTAGSNNGKSAYIRLHFSITDPAKVYELKFRANYDDGFVAYLNGQQIAASTNLPAPLAYNSNVTASGHDAGTFTEYDLTSQISTLVAGDNVIAVQALNRTTSNDFFFLSELTAKIDNPLAITQSGYFSVATPNAVNGGTDTIQLPQTVTFQKGTSPNLVAAPSGPFTASFNLTLGGNGAGQQVRYVMVDPSNAGATQTEPTASSTLYVAGSPISISSSKLIRAAVFNSSNGQKGKTTTMQYLLLETAAGSNNTSTFTSNLPIMVIDDHGDAQAVDSSTGTYTPALLYIFNPVGGTATLNSAPAYFSRAGFRVRGRTSSGFPKKGYGMETWTETNDDMKVSLLGLASDSDWILTNPWSYDDVFIHNAFIFEVSRRIGRWAPRTRMVELFTNINGGKLDYADYNGVYAFSEKIEQGSNRVDITELGGQDISGDAVTGGYIFKFDDIESTEVGWTAPSSSTIDPVLVEPDITPSDLGTAVSPVVNHPNPNKIAQFNYIKNYVNTFDSVLYAEKNANFTTRNYRKYIDVPSFIDHSMLEILAYNVDAFWLSSFFNKDRNGKIKAGPIWDFDRSLNSDDGRDANPRSWTSISITYGWWGYLLKDPEYVQAWVDRWWELRSGPLSDANLAALVDQLGNEVGAAAGARDAAKWPGDVPESGSYLGEVAAMRNWLTSTDPDALGRTNWMDSQFPKPVTVDTASGVVAPGTTVTLTGGDTVRYTTNGTDPRPYGGDTASTADTYTGTPISINQTTVLTTRTQGTYGPVLPGAVTINWGPPTTAVYLVNEAFAVAGDLTVSEINYNPLGATDAEKAGVLEASPDDFEFIELKNTGNRTVNTFEVKFVDGIPFKEIKLSALSLAPGDTALVVKNKEAFLARYPDVPAAKIVGEWKEGALSNGGESIQITARDGSPIQTFSYSDTGLWPFRADGLGSTLEYKGTAFTSTDFNNPSNWRDSSEVQGSPGANGSGPDSRVVINEILAHSNSPRVDAIELFNTSAAPVDISGWYLSDAKSPGTADSFKQFRIPDGTVLAAGAYKVYTEADFNPNGAWNSSAGTPGEGEFAFDAHHGDTALLLQGDPGGTAVLKFIDDVDFGATPSDESIGRWPNGTGAFYPMLTRTLLNEASGSNPQPGLGATNSGPRSGPIVLNEIQHSPLTGGTAVQFIEIRNTGLLSQSLAHWSILGSVRFDFAQTDTIVPGGLLVVVPFLPADTAKATAFRTKYSISASVPLVGPWTSTLGTSGDIMLYRADTPSPEEPGYYPLLVEDGAYYFSSNPWPVALGGPSLNRLDITAVGDDYAAWKTDAPSPGTAGPTYVQWKALYFPSGGIGSNNGDDSDLDGVSNTLEYGRGTNPLLFESPSSYLPAFAWQSGGGTGNYVYTYTKPADRPGVQYQVQQSSDLVNWTNVSDVLVSTAANRETRSVIMPAGGSTPAKLFFRLKTTVTP